MKPIKSNLCVYGGHLWMIVEVFDKTVTLASGSDAEYGVPIRYIELVKPVVVHAGGFYRTRSGFPVWVDKVDPVIKSTFNAKGSVYKKRRGLHINPDYCIWRSCNGTSVGVGISDNDLIEIDPKDWNKLIEKRK